MTLTLRLLPLAAALALAGCRSTPPVRPALQNSLTIQINNDATGALTTRGGWLHVYDSPRCENGVRKANRMSLRSQDTLTTVPLTPGKPVTFAVTTVNAKSFKGNWGCSATATFTPAAGGMYHAILQTANDNATCKLVVMDREDRVVPSASPEYSCAKTFNGLVRNGTRYSYSPLRSN